MNTRSISKHQIGHMREFRPIYNTFDQSQQRGFAFIDNGTVKQSKKFRGVRQDIPETSHSISANRDMNAWKLFFDQRAEGHGRK